MSTSPRTQLRRMTAAKNATRQGGRFAAHNAVYDLAGNLRSELRALLVKTNGEEHTANAITNTLATALAITAPMPATQCRIYQTVIDYVRGLAMEHPGAAFRITTALAPVLTDKDVAPGLVRQMQNPDSEYWAALSLDASYEYEIHYGIEARDAFLDEIDHLNLTWQAGYIRLMEKIQ